MEQTSSIVQASEVTSKAIVPQTEDISLADLTQSDTGKTLHVRVYRKWTPTNNQGKPVLFCCVLIDRQGNAIQANINFREKNKFDALLQKNKTYRITGYGFQPARPYMQVVPHSLSLVFGTYTEIKEIPDTGFPNHYFSFRNYRELYSLIDKKEGLLTDYIGSVQYVTGIQKSLKTTKDSAVWRDIGVQNLDGHTVRFTLWNQDAHNFRQEEYEKADNPKIIAVSSCLVKDYKGLQLSTTNATEYYFNPDIPQYHEICSVYAEFIDPPTILNVEHQKYADPQQEMHRNRVTLAELARENPENQKNVRFTVNATIDKIETKRPWFFKKCSDCKLKINEQWPHTQCKQPTSEDELIYSYCFRVQLSDNTGNATMTCFSNEANSMVKDCKELLRTMPNQNSYEYPAEILSLQGKRKIFQMHFDPDSTKEQQIFILDTCWEAIPLLTSGHATVGESSIRSTESATLPKEESDPLTPSRHGTISEATIGSTENATLPKEGTNNTPAIDTATNITVSKNKATEGVAPKETETTPITKQISTSEPPKPKNEVPKKTARRALFTETEEASAPSGTKKSKK